MSKASTERQLPPLAIVATHSTQVFGPPFALINHFKQLGWDVFEIDHPLDFDSKRQTKFTWWRGQEQLAVQAYPNWLSMTVINYLKDFTLTCWILFRYARTRQVQCYVGCDSISTIAALWLRPLVAIKSIISYNTDYSTTRFNQRLINAIYLWADRYVSRRVDSIWCVTERIAAIRRQEIERPTPIVLMPNGVYLDQAQADGPHNQGLVFIGNLTAEKGLDQVLRALAKTKQAKLTIYGDGGLRSILEKLAYKLGLSSRVTFAGRVDNATILASLNKYEAGIALYQDSQSYVYYSDPLKVKEYLASGLPVVISDVPEIAAEIRQAGAGIVLSQSDDLGDALCEIESEGKGMQKKAAQLAKRYDWDTLFTNALIKSGVQ